MLETRRDPVPLSSDQAAAWAVLSARLAAHGVDLEAGTTAPRADAAGASEVLAVTGKAGSGKTVLLAELATRLAGAGLRTVRPDYEPRRRDARSFAVLAPTNKAASVLQARGVPATTIHRIVYTPVYDPDFEEIAEWIAGERHAKPASEVMSADALDRAKASFDSHGSVASALAAAGVRGSDFITGWKRRDEPLDIALVDEASMIEPRQLADLAEIFGLVILFGDPAQLAPVGERGEMVFDSLEPGRRLSLERIHRQAEDSPILDLAHLLGRPGLGYGDFEDEVRERAARDPRVIVAQRADSDLMCESPMLVWRNKTRLRLIAGFRAAHNIEPDSLVPGEPLICDGLELPLKRRKERIALEAHGLIKGAQAVYLGPGSKPAYQRVRILGTGEPGINVASIIQIEQPDGAEPILVSAARMGAVFLHGAAVTIHKAQGSQWPRVQVFAPDLWAAAQAGQVEAGLPLWKRLAYVAITRAEHDLIWVTQARIGRAAHPLGGEAPAPGQ
ncbi:MAG: AAA family ATPase [Thermohalobaculum sp.]|nr:AAA family ATPase [Thermohalobaculum sp.]